MRKTLIAVSLGLVGLVAVAGSNARPLKPEEEARIQPVGKPVSCIGTAEIDESRVRSNEVIDFYMKGGKVYRVRLPNGCPQLGFEERFSYKTVMLERHHHRPDRSRHQPGPELRHGRFPGSDGRA